MGQSNQTNLEEITKELYKKNSDLFNLNKELSLLEKLYEITATSFDMEKLSREFIELIVKDLEFQSGSVMLLDQKEDLLKAVVVTNGEANTEPLNLFGVPLGELQVSLLDRDNLIVKTFKTGKRQVTHSLLDILTPVVSDEQATKIAQTAGIKSTIVFPISFGTQNLGVFSLSTDREIEDLSESKKRLLNRIEIVFGVAVDRLKIYLELQKVNRMLKEMDKQKDEFLSMAAHELRAPMTAIKGYVSMVLEGDTGDIPEKARGFLADTSNITDRLIRLVNNMLNVSRIEEGRLTFQEEEEYLSRPVRSVYNQFLPEAERKSLEYTLEIPTEMKDKVLVDPDRIQEVIGNFISNAVKYTDTGFIKVKMSQPSLGFVRVEVIDSGPGIAKEEQKILFQKFRRVESNVGKTTGSGLGLYISKLLVEKFKGKIGIDSDTDKGSNFWFELPVI